MDYEKMWQRLEDELRCLCMQGVKVVSARMVIGYMTFIRELEEHREKSGGEE